MKASRFVMTLRDNYNDLVARSSTSPILDSSNVPTDEWAFEYISIAYLQPIMEAFDDDGSGYVTVAEVNRFMEALPPTISWT